MPKIAKPKLDYERAILGKLRERAKELKLLYKWKKKNGLLVPSKEKKNSILETIFKTSGTKPS